jgi:uncharacterized protein (TIGR03083 family)
MKVRRRAWESLSMESALARTAFEEATASFVSAVADVAPDGWRRPATDAWDVRELVAHTSRALVTVEQYLGAPVGRPGPGSSAEYFATALATPGIHDDVAARGRDQAEALGVDPAATVAELASRVVELVRSQPDDATVGTFLGDMRLVDYLPTRVVELVVHTLDLAEALGMPAQLGTTASQVALATLAATAPLRPERVDPVGLIRSLTGRASWPSGSNVVG